MTVDYGETVAALYGMRIGLPADGTRLRVV